MPRKAQKSPIFVLCFLVLLVGFLPGFGFWLAAVTCVVDDRDLESLLCCNLIVLEKCLNVPEWWRELQKSL